MRAHVGRRSAPPGMEAAGWGTGSLITSVNVEGLAASLEIGFVSGRSNLTCRVTDAADTAYSLRRLPTRGVLSTARDVSRE